MKIFKLIIFIFLIAYTVLFGIDDISGAISNYNQYTILNEEKEKLMADYETALDGKGTAIETAESLFGKTSDELKDKTSIVENVLSMPDVSLVEAKASSIVGGTEIELSTVDNKTDILNFDDSVNCINFKLKYKDLDKTLDSIKDLKLCINNISVDLDNNEISVKVIFLNGGAA